MNATDSAEQSNSSAEPEAPSFADMGLSPEVSKAIADAGYEKPTPVQFAAYKPAIAQKDIIVQARTGTGKTAAFGIPLVDKLVREAPGVQALVLAPTRELALQSARELERLGKYRKLSTVAVYGGAPMGPQIDDLKDGAQIVSGTPGRVLDHLKRGTLDASQLRVLVLDEMDEMLSMGFARELNAILELIPDSENRQTMCFSATVDGAIRRHAERHMKDPVVVTLSSDAAGATQISHAVFMVGGTNRAGDLIQILNIENPESAIVFCNMRAETERVATELQRAGFNADWLNGDMPQKERERIMSRTREGKLRYLVATDVAARGIDISHLTHVINFSFPESAATYVHRTGRTGRAGRTGNALSLVSPQELGRLYYLRLEYGITPVERSLPNSGEQKTQQELDRLNLLEGSVKSQPSADDTALARRLLTHPDVERILGSLLHSFFGGDGEKNVDERAASARRDKAPAIVATPQTPRTRRADYGNDKDSRRGRGKRDERPRENRGRPRDEDEAIVVSTPARTADAADPDRGRLQSRGEAPKRRRRRTPSTERAESSTPVSKTGQTKPSSETDSKPREAPVPAATAEEQKSPRPARRRQRAPRPSSDGAVATSGVDNMPPSQDGPLLATEDAAAEPRKARPRARVPSRSADEAPHSTVFLNVGKRDGAKTGEIVRLMEETGGLDKADVGRVRMRDRYTYVDVPEGQIDIVLDRLKNAEVADCPVDAEKAKVSRS